MITFGRRRGRLPLWRFVALGLCETALLVLYVAIFLEIAGPIAVSMARSIDAREERECRLAFAKIGEYPALADVCKDAKARRAILMWDAIDGAARRVE